MLLAPFVVLMAGVWIAGYAEPPLGLPVPTAVLGIVALWLWQAYMEYSKRKKGS